MFVYGKRECFVMQMLYVCVLCAVPNADFCTTCSLLMLVEDARGRGCKKYKHSVPLLH